MFIKLKNKIRRTKIKKLLDQNWVNSFLSSRIKNYFPGAKKIINLEVIILRNFLGKFRNITARYCLTLQFNNNRKKNKNILVKINTINLGPYRWKEAVKKLQQKDFKQAPRLLDYLPALNTLFYEEIKGHALQETLNKKNINQIIKITPQISKLIYQFHSLKIKNFFFVKNKKEEQREYRHWLFLIKKCLPSFEKRFRKIYYLLIDFKKKNKNIFLKEKEYILTHGDFHLGNIILSQSGLKIVDFGDTNLYDPMEDVGSFLAQTESMLKYTLPQKYKKDYKKIENLFLKHYFKTGISLEEKKRIIFFKAKSFLQMAAIFSFIIWPLKNKKRAIERALSFAQKELVKLIEK